MKVYEILYRQGFDGEVEFNHLTNRNDQNPGLLHVLVLFVSYTSIVSLISHRKYEYTIFRYFHLLLTVSLGSELEELA